MEKSMCRFLLGLGVGSVLGAIAHRCSQTEKAKELKKKMCCAVQQAAEEASEWMTGAKEKAAEMTGKVADEVSDKAETVAQKADDAKSKFQSYNGK